MKKLLISALALFVVGSVAAQEGLGETYTSTRTCSLYWSIFECDTFRIETFEIPRLSNACHTFETSAADLSFIIYKNHI